MQRPLDALGTLQQGCPYPLPLELDVLFGRPLDVCLDGPVVEVVAPGERGGLPAQEYCELFEPLQIVKEGKESVLGLGVCVDIPKPLDVLKRSQRLLVVPQQPVERITSLLAAVPPLEILVQSHKAIG